MISIFKITCFQPLSKKMHHLILTFFARNENIACRCCPVGTTNKIDISWFRNVNPSKESMSRWLTTCTQTTSSHTQKAYTHSDTSSSQWVHQIWPCIDSKHPPSGTCKVCHKNARRGVWASNSNTNGRTDRRTLQVNYLPASPWIKMGHPNKRNWGKEVPEWVYVFFWICKSVELASLSVAVGVLLSSKSVLTSKVLCSSWQLHRSAITMRLSEGFHAISKLFISFSTTLSRQINWLKTEINFKYAAMAFDFKWKMRTIFPRFPLKIEIRFEWLHIYGSLG